MTFMERLAAIRAAMAEAELDLLIGVHEGSHFIERPNPVMVLTQFKALGAAAAVMDRTGERKLVVTPAWEAERAAEAAPDVEVRGTDDLIEGLAAACGGKTGAIGICGLSELSWPLVARLRAAFPGARAADAAVFRPARFKTDEEIAWAREAARIAERAYEHLKAIARPGRSEDEIAAEICWYTKSLGAEDNFLLLCAGPHNRAVQPSTGRRLAAGDILLAEITPSYRGQLAQICRTMILGRASETLAKKYALVTEAMHAGIRAARPGVPMAEVCRAINRVLEAEGYAQYCHPPYIRRRGHGLGFASTEPGDVSLDNAILLEPGMLFMIHPNQYLPETGYLLCGEPVLLGSEGATPLTYQMSALIELA